MSKAPIIARRMADIEPFHVMDLLARARRMEADGRSVVHMEIGEPDFPTPAPILLAGQRALAEGHTHYTPAAGLPALRAAIAGHYRDDHGLDIDPARIIVTPGASGALLLALAVTVDPGAEVLLADPGYPCNRHFLRLVEGVAKAVPVDASVGYQLQPELVAEHWGDATAGVLVASPSNPTGSELAPGPMRELTELVATRRGFMIVDEIYLGLEYGPRAPSALTWSDQIFVINSFSKYYGMTGWRLGWLVAPERFAEPADRLAQNLFLAASTPAQHAALAAFEADTRQILDARRDAFRERRDFLLPELRRLGFEVPIEPDGAFYLYADCSAHGDDSFRLSHRLLEEVGVAVTPGVDFGRYRSERHLRFAYTTELAQLAEGIARIDRLLNG